MLLEIHTHTAEHSPCSKIAAVDLLQFVLQQGVQGVALTDHHYLWSDAELAELRTAAALPDDFLLLSGQEVTTSDLGDVLVFGADSAIEQFTLVDTIRSRYPDAALVWAHPYRGNRRPTSVELFNAAIDAIEIINPRQWKTGNEAGVADWQEWGFVATGGTDIHDAEPMAFYPTEFSVRIRTLGDLVTAIRNGDCCPKLDHPYTNPRRAERDQWAEEMAKK